MRVSRILKLSSVALAAAIMAGCATQTSQPTAGPATLSHAQALFQSGDYAQAAKTYQRLLADATPDQRSKWLLKAAQAWAKADKPTKALQALQAIAPASLSGQAFIKKWLLSAQLFVTKQQPNNALQSLDILTQSGLTLSRDTRNKTHKLRGAALFGIGKPVAATLALVQRSALIDGATAHAHNRNLIWQGLSRSRRALAQAPQSDNTIVQGWVALAHITGAAWQQPNQLGAHLQQWQSQHPQHPATGKFLNQLTARFHQRTSYSGVVALLAPFDGAQADAAKAVRDGALAAYLSSHGHADAGSTDSSIPTLRIYNTHGSADGTLAAYKQARADGATVIIGPLKRSNLQALANEDAFTLPTLSLVNLPVDTHATTLHNTATTLLAASDNTADAQARFANLYQFGLEPTDEARQAARRVVRDGHMRGVMLAPATKQGTRMIAAFKKQLQALGGQLLASQQYQHNSSNFSRTLKRVFNLNQSKARARALESVIGQDVNYTPRRRQDIQFIFMVADNAQARLLRPQIRFHRGIRLPVYATSKVYEPNSASQYDLNGVIFMETPWTLSNDSTITSMRQTLQSLWPERYDAVNQYYALGYDAYRLVPLLMNTRNPLALAAQGVTGNLTLDNRQRIHHLYIWAQYDKGAVNKLSSPREP